MAKFPPNLPCPCGSGKKYKKCCAPYHRGAIPKSALILMKSRYSAYAAGESDYIIKTTHPDNPDFTDRIAEWKNAIDDFSRQTAFLGLEILDFSASSDEAFVTFRALLSGSEMIEKSRFLKIGGRWLYVDGTFIDREN